MNYYYSQNEAIVIGLTLGLLTIPATFTAFKRKNRSAIWVWVFLTFMFPPLFLVVECLSNKSIKTVQMIACEACHHEISSASKTCPHCGHPNPLYKKTKIPFYEWFVGILIVIFIPLSLIFPPTLTNNGIPNCDTAFTKNLAIQTLKNIPMFHILGITAIDLKDIQETEYASNQRKCKATATLSNDTKHTVSYTLSKQENSIYLQLQLID